MEETIYELKVPIFGFDNLKKVEIQKIDDLFIRMINLDSANNTPSFLLANPFKITKDYKIDVPEHERNLLNLDESKKFEVYNMIVLDNPVSESFINLASPIIFNIDNKYAGQIILDAYGVDKRLSDFL
jgi:flagellar assembly factor FliW